jgi:hypothetical protein
MRVSLLKLFNIRNQAKYWELLKEAETTLWRVVTVDSEG